MGNRNKMRGRLCRAFGGRRGFSLIEVLVSSSLFFVGLTAVFSAYHTGERIVNHNLHMTRAITIVETTLEALVERYPGDPLLDLGTHTGPSYTADGALAAGDDVYDVTWTVSLYSRLAGIREITATVRWRENGERDREVAITTWRL